MATKMTITEDKLMNKKVITGTGRQSVMTT